MAKKKTNLTYQQAYAELEGIVQQIESEEPDVDQIGSLVKRAAELLDFCKGRLRQTEEEVLSALQDSEE